MQFVERLLKWLKEQRDPVARARRDQLRKAEKMARFLEQNKQVDSESDQS